MKLLILGPTGGVGRHLVRLAHARGHEVAALTRSPLDAGDGLAVFQGSPLQEADLRRAGAGCEAVVSALGLRRASLFPWSKLTSPPDLNAEVARRIVRLAPEVGWRRVVWVSAAGVGDSAPAMNVVMRILVSTSSIGVAYRDLDVAEQVYAASQLDWHACRPVALTDRPARGAARVVETFGMNGFISREAVAAWMLDRAERGDLVPRTPMISE